MRKSARKSSLAVAAIFAAMSANASAESWPDYVRHSTYVPINGTKLAVNIYRPANGATPATEKLPVIFVYTPYRARYRDEKGQVQELALSDRLALRSLLRAGYVVATADVRGKGASFGARRGFLDDSEAKDGHDLVEWLARQPFSTGNVGMLGCSYLGGSTFKTVTTTPPSLKAAFIGATDLDKYDFVRRGGIPAQFNTRPDEPPEVDLASIPVDADTDGSQLKAAVAEHAKNTPMAPLWYGMPYRDSVSEYTNSQFWAEASPWPHLDAVRKSGIATYFWSNWEDEPTAQAILSAANLPGSKFLAGPGSHCVPPPGFDFTGEVQRFFDHHLKGSANGIDKEPRATFWVGGLKGADGKDGGYVRSDRLPGEEVVPASLYAADAGSGGAGATLAAKPAAAGEDAFTVDYNVSAPAYFDFWVMPQDGKGLSYTTAPLTRPMTLIGFPVADLKVAADRRDANVFAYLEEVDKAGKSRVVSFGRIALSQRKLGEAPYDMMGLPWHTGRKADAAPVEPGEAVDVRFDLTPVSLVVPEGSRLRMTVTGADPRQRNLKEIAENPPPRITLSLGGKDGSRIALPVAELPAGRIAPRPHGGR